MTEPVFLFGSFTEDEAQQFQASVPESPSPKGSHCSLKPALKENGFHPAHNHYSELKSAPKAAPSKVSAAAQNGLSPAPKLVPKPNSWIVGNGKQPESANTASRIAGRGVKKQVLSTAVGLGTQKSGKQGDVKPPAANIHIAENPLMKIANDGVADRGYHADRTPFSSQDFSEANGQGPPCAVVTPLKQNGIVSGKLGSKEEAVISSSVSSQLAIASKIIWGSDEISGKSSQGKQGFDLSRLRTTSDGDSDVVASEFMPKSWAALVGVPTDSVDMDGASGFTKRKAKDAQKRHPGSPQSQVPAVTVLSGDIWLKSLRKADSAGRRLLPRGLVNTGNSCFLNSTMQAMLSCPAFTHLLQVLKDRTVPQHGYPTLRAFVNFFVEFEPLPDTNGLKVRREVDGKVPSVEVGRPFVPAMFDGILQSFTPDQPPRAKGRNRQEDAQEFLSFVMDRMHEEILRLQGNDSPVSQSSPSGPSFEDGDWEMVGPKNRTSVTRTHQFSESAVTDIFGGQLRSVVKTKGNKASATVQPFLVLHLDIVPEFVHSVEDALRMFAAPEFVEGYKPATAKVGEVVAASKSVKIQTLPRVLILHLMRFSYGSGGSSKLHKPVQFPLEVTLGRELLASSTGSGNESRRYELVATVSHHGKDPSVGHYTTDSKQASGQWLRFDDGAVSAISVNRVQQEQVYVLFYKRLGV
ncbi:hypothetical protein Mapa_001159 [Marchantia paleacea]|nr:hypothetical protein Mapa_001159 [Marchantia paleacea]